MSTQSDSFETLYYADQSDFGENETRTSVSQYGSSSIKSKSNVELLENESDCCCNIL
jgi:hypothetical protein